MTKQTPERFAKNVLWQLAGIRAAIAQLQGPYLLHLAALTGTPPKQVGQKAASEILKMQKKLFAEMAESSDLN